MNARTRPFNGSSKPTNPKNLADVQRLLRRYREHYNQRRLPNRASWYGCSGYWVPPPFIDRVLQLRLAGTASGPMNATTDQANNFTQFSGLFSKHSSKSPGVKIQSTCCGAWTGPSPSLRQLVGTRFGTASTGRGNMRPPTIAAGFPWRND